MPKSYSQVGIFLFLLVGCVDSSPRQNPATVGTDAAVVVDSGLNLDTHGDLAIAISPLGGEMRDLTSMALVKEMAPGWNLGNTLDAVGGEQAWGNPATTQAMIQAVVAAGFKAIRIPVTWRQHFGAGPNYAIDPVWMARVKTIVDWTLEAGGYAIINLHHDGGTDYTKGAWLRKASTDYVGVMTQFLALWNQIAAYFQDYPDRLVFESMNEVGFDDLNVNGQPPPAAYTLLNGINNDFVRLVRGSGGNNGQRHLLIAGYNTDFDLTIRGVIMPTDPRCILSLHYYTPYQFAINGSPTTWGRATEIATLQGLFAKVKTNFIDKGVPVILGEFGATKKTEIASRIFWSEWVAKAACDLGIAPYFWDPGDEFNRTTLVFRTTGLVEALVRACSGVAYTPTKG